METKLMAATVLIKHIYKSTAQGFFRCGPGQCVDYGSGYTNLHM